MRTATATPARVPPLPPGGLTDLPSGSICSRGDRPDSDVRSFVISAVDGAMLFHNNLVVNDSTFRVWADGRRAFCLGQIRTAQRSRPTRCLPRRPPADVPGEQARDAENAPFSKTIRGWQPAPGSSPTTPSPVPTSQARRPKQRRPHRPGTAADTPSTTAGPGRPPIRRQPDRHPRRHPQTCLVYRQLHAHDYFYDSGCNEASRNTTSRITSAAAASAIRRAESQDYSTPTTPTPRRQRTAEIAAHQRYPMGPDAEPDRQQPRRHRRYLPDRAKRASDLQRRQNVGDSQ